jgi:hypothetical protein
MKLRCFHSFNSNITRKILVKNKFVLVFNYDFKFLDFNFKKKLKLDLFKMSLLEAAPICHFYW